MKQLIGTNLKRFLRDYRRENQLDGALAAILNSVAYPANVGSAFRLADGAGFEELILCGITPQPPNPTLEKVARAKTSRVPWRYEESAAVAVTQKKASGFQVVALELTDEATPYFEFNYAENCCLVVGNEDHGVTRDVLNECDASVFIPMYGKGLSLNVHMALGVLAYHVLQCRHSAA